MSLVNPILAGLAAAFVALPIVLHFLRRRRPPVMWGAMRFLLEAYRRTRRRMTLEQLLLLASRCLLVLLVAAMVGRPVVGGDPGASGPGEVYILLDNSIASGLRSEGSAALEELRSRALAALDGLDAAAGDRAALVLLGGPAESVVLPPSGDLAGVRRAIESATLTDSRADLAGALAAVAESIGSSPDRARPTVLLLSMLREGSAEVGRALPALPEGVRLVALEPGAGPAANTSITGFEPARRIIVGDQASGGQAAVALARSGAGLDAEHRVEIRLTTGAGGEIGRGEAVFPPGQAETSAMVGFTLPPGEASLTIAAQITGDALPADDAFVRPLPRRRVLQVGLIAPRSIASEAGPAGFAPADWVRLALSPTGEGEIRPVDLTPAALDRPRLAALDALVVLDPEALGDAAWSELRVFVARGGLLVLTPGTREGVQLWTDRLQTALGLPWTVGREPTRGEPAPIVAADGGAEPLLGVIGAELRSLLSGVTVSRVLEIDGAATEAGTLLRTGDGRPVLIAGTPVGEDGAPAPGLVVYLASALSLEWTDLPARPIMVPLMQEIVRQGVGVARGVSSETAGMLPAGVVDLVDARGEPAEAPIRRAGVYRSEDGPRGMTVAVNADAAGSRVGVLDWAGLEAWLGRAAGGPDRVSWLNASGEQSGTRPGVEADVAGSERWALWIAAGALALCVLETVAARIVSRGAEPSGVTA